MENGKIDLNSKGVFWTRLVLWILSCIEPVIFIGWRYNIFGKVSNTTLSGWGLICGLILFVFLIVFLCYLLKVKKWAYWKQVVKGITFLILPLGLCAYGLNCAKENIDDLIQVIMIGILCWSIAIVINPMPRWVYEKSKGETADMIDFALDRRENKQNTNASIK